MVGVVERHGLGLPGCPESRVSSGRRPESIGDTVPSRCALSERRENEANSADRVAGRPVRHLGRLPPEACQPGDS